MLKCNPKGFCLKLINSAQVFQKEEGAYQHLQKSRKARDLFLPIFFFCDLKVGACEQALWKGYYMKQACPTTT